MSSSVISSSSSSSDSTKDEKRAENGRFMCTAQGCHQAFRSTGELAIHEQKHQMTLKLGPARTGITDMLPFDQTPTPTKFLQYGKETGLFEEISNPFDSEFKRSTSRLREKAQRSAVPGLIIDHNKARTPTSLPFASQPVAQPVHVITLTPTLPSPVIGGGQLFIPPLPSPQGFLPSPAALISPSIVPFSAPGLFPSVQAVVEQHAALAQAFLHAASASNATMATSNNNQIENVSTSQTHMSASRTSSITDLPNSAAPLFPTHNVSVPVNNNPTPPTCHAMPGQNIPSAPVGSASVIQQHIQPSMEQRRPLSQSNSLDRPTHPNSGNLERKRSFHGETSVITQAPAHSSTSQMNTNNMIMHTGNATGFQYMTQQQSLPPFSQLAADASGRLSNHPVLTASRSVPTPAHNNIQNHEHTLPHQNSLPGIDAKQKLKETLTTNNPNLHMEMPSMQSQYSLDLDDDDERSLNEVSSSSGIGDGQKVGRRRGRRNADDPDTKRMRFLERNRAAASRCRAKKKQWVSGLEVKAKELSNSNVGLQSEVAELREEVASLKQLLLAHRDCPITRLQQHKLAIAGGDPSAVVSNPVQAAASLLGIEKEENIEMQGNEGSQSNNGDVKLGVGMPNMEMQMTSSLLVSANHACKSECPMDEYPQVSSTSAIALNTNFGGSNPNLSSSAGT